MDKLCEDCVHNEICRYDAICITGHCNDKETLEDLCSVARKQGYECGYAQGYVDGSTGAEMKQEEE